MACGENKSFTNESMRLFSWEISGINFPRDVKTGSVIHSLLFMHNNNLKKIGIFGGTFDPIHLGHLHLANEVLAHMDLDLILFVPCCESGYNKKIFASSKQRLDMVRLAIQPFKKFLLDDREILRGNVSYTIDTLVSLQQDYIGAQFYLLMADDTFVLFNTWYKWQEIIKMTNFIVVNRTNFANEAFCDHLRELNLLAEKMSIVEKVTFLQNSSLPISSTEIRKLVSNKKSAKDLLPKSVWQYILENGLYTHIT